jgi:uncharacterized protein (TIGR02757 family)
VEFLRRFHDPKDIEIAGFLASQFAYGRIEVFKKFLSGIFDRMGERPEKFIEEGDFSCLKGLYYRFHKDTEIISLFGMLKRITDEFGGLGGMVRGFYGGDLRETLWTARRYLLGEKQDLLFFFPKPLRSNPLKRWNLYFRWMVRKDDVDVGLWNFIDKATLTIPLDTHIFKIGRCLGWTNLNSPSWNAAREITDALKRFCPEDPLKYDLLLCHRVGIGAGCTGKRMPVCDDKCILVG